MNEEINNKKLQKVVIAEINNLSTKLSNLKIIEVIHRMQHKNVNENIVKMYLDIVDMINREWLENENALHLHELKINKEERKKFRFAIVLEEHQNESVFTFKIIKDGFLKQNEKIISADFFQNESFKNKNIKLVLNDIFFEDDIEDWKSLGVEEIRPHILKNLTNISIVKNLIMPNIMKKVKAVCKGDDETDSLWAGKFLQKAVESSPIIADSILSIISDESFIQRYSRSFKQVCMRAFKYVNYHIFDDFNEKEKFNTFFSNLNRESSGSSQVAILNALYGQLIEFGFKSEQIIANDDVMSIYKKIEQVSYSDDGARILYPVEMLGISMKRLEDFKKVDHNIWFVTIENESVKKITTELSVDNYKKIEKEKNDENGLSFTYSTNKFFEKLQILNSNENKIKFNVTIAHLLSKLHFSNFEIENDVRRYSEIGYQDNIDKNADEFNNGIKVLFKEDIVNIKEVKQEIDFLMNILTDIYIDMMHYSLAFKQRDMKPKDFFAMDATTFFEMNEKPEENQRNIARLLNEVGENLDVGKIIKHLIITHKEYSLRKVLEKNDEQKIILKRPKI